MNVAFDTPVRTAGWQFLQIPGPTNVPERVRLAIARPTIDHRGDAFAALAKGVLRDLGPIFGTTGEIVVFPASGTGAWEAALVNVTSPGDRVVMAETGHFSNLWHELACRLGLSAELLSGSWRRGTDPAIISAALRRDAGARIKAVCVVHNETSTGAVSDIVAIRRAIDEVGHPALLIVDTISSLGSMPYKHDDWGVDVTVAGSQKGLMLPPGLGFNAYGTRARKAHENARMPRGYFDWTAMADVAESGSFPYTPATNLLFGLREAIDMLSEERLEAVFERHRRHARATQAAVEGWGLEVLCEIAGQRSASLTAVLMPDGVDADALRGHVMTRFNMPLGNGLSMLSGRVFRIGHLGDFSDLMLAATLAGIQLGLREIGVPLAGSGVEAALGRLALPGAAGSAA